MSEATKPRKVVLYDANTDAVIDKFDSVEQAMDYADLHDLQCYIKHEDIIGPMS